MILISNNSLTAGWENTKPDLTRISISGDALAVLAAARDYIHRHWLFLADPGAGRDKHRRNPFLSVWLEGPETELSLRSLELLESLLLQERRACGSTAPEAWQNDFQHLDAALAAVVLQGVAGGSECID